MSDGSIFIFCQRTVEPIDSSGIFRRNTFCYFIQFLLPNHHWHNSTALRIDVHPSLGILQNVQALNRQNEGIRGEAM